MTHPIDQPLGNPITEDDIAHYLSNSPDFFHFFVHGGWITGAIRKEDTVGAKGENLSSGRGSWNYSHPTAKPRQFTKRVSLNAKVVTHYVKSLLAFR